MSLSYAGKCPSSSAAQETSPPAGAFYKLSTDKYYKYYSKEADKKNWHAAQVECSSLGATLVEGGTPGEHEVFLVLASK